MEMHVMDDTLLAIARTTKQTSSVLSSHSPPDPPLCRRPKPPNRHGFHNGGWGGRRLDQIDETCLKPAQLSKSEERDRQTRHNTNING